MSALSMIRTGSLAFALIALGSADLHAEEPKGDLKIMQGEWVSKDDNGDSTWKFEGDKLTLKAPGRTYEIVVKLDEAAKPFKTIELNASEDSPNAKGFKGPGIYKLDGEKTLTICFGASNSRPTEFKTDFAASTFTFELKKK